MGGCMPIFACVVQTYAAVRPLRNRDDVFDEYIGPVAAYRRAAVVRHGDHTGHTLLSLNS